MSSRIAWTARNLKAADQKVKASISSGEVQVWKRQQDAQEDALDGVEPEGSQSGGEGKQG